MAEVEIGIKEYKVCPVCGSPERYCEEMGNKEKARGHMRKEMGFCFQVIEGVCVDKGLEGKLPMGTELPAYHVTADICVKCGTIYVTSIEESRVKKQPNLVMPKQGGGFGMGVFPGARNPQGN